PYQGAATGVGGIMRDVFTMGARPIAMMNALRFGEPDHPKTRHLVSGVVSGIGGYGNCMGVPTVGGEVNFHKSYNGNILVNAMCVGLARSDRIFKSAAKGAGNPVVYVGSKTGRDGIHGATMASAEFSEDAQEKRPTVQVGDPFTEKLLLEACLELMATDAIIRKWELDFAVIGVTTDTGRLLVKHKGEVAADIPVDALSEEAPVYRRPFSATPPSSVGQLNFSTAADIGFCLLKLLASPDLCSRRWIWQQYDYSVMADTVQPPGGDAAVVRVHGTTKALAITTDVTPRYCRADPFEGAKQAVAEAWRNLTAT